MRSHSFYPYLLAATVTAALGCKDEVPSPTGPEPAPASAVPDFAVASNSWITRRDMPSTQRWSLATATVENAAGQSILYVIGGATATGGSLSAVQAYNVATDTWTYKASLPTPLFSTNGAGVVNGKVYISGGLSGYQAYRSLVYMYDPATNTWTRKRDMPHPTSGGVTEVINNQLYVLTNCGPDFCNFSDDVPLFYRYDPATDVWTSLPAPRNSHSEGMAGVMGGKFHVTGGFTGVGNPRRLDVYDPATNQWTGKLSIPRQRWKAVGVALAGKLYLIGGYEMTADGSAAPAIRKTTVYDPRTDTWTTKAPLPSARADVGGSRVKLNGKPRIEVVGGTRPGNNLAYIP
jgi:N-acetylneuraminic acid mutarotase